MWADVDGARLYYERRGSGPPLLWITGFTISAEIFGPALPHYERAYECILYDNRGAGRSRSLPGLTSMAQLAADAAGLLAALEIPSAHVYGLSMGGMIAQELALRFPERVRGLILGATTPGGPLAARPTLSELRLLGRAMTADSRRRGRPSLAAALFTEDFRRRHPERVRALLPLFAAHRATLTGVASHWWASVYHDTVSRLPEIQAPTLVVHGEHDAMAPLKNARLLADRIPDAELAIVPRGGHAYLLEQPEESARLVLDWLARRGDIPPGRPRPLAARTWEPVTRRLGLPIGAARTGVSLARRVASRR